MIRPDVLFSITKSFTARLNVKKKEKLEQLSQVRHFSSRFLLYLLVNNFSRRSPVLLGINFVVNGTRFSVMSSYLLGRQQCVRLEGVCSNFKTVKSGVPQG